MQNKTQTVDINLLDPNEYNSNKMPDVKFTALVETIKRYGQTHPIQVVVNKDRFRIIGGEHRWRAMKMLKFTQVEILVRKFEDDIDEKLASVEDNLSGNPIPLKEAMIVASAIKKYKLSDLQKRIGQTEPELKDKLILVGEADKLEKLKENIELEHTVEMDFVVDTNPQDNAERFITEISKMATRLGATVMKSSIKLSKTKDAVALVTFNVSESQKSVIETAIKSLMVQEEITKGRALEFLCAESIATNGIHEKQPKKLSPKKFHKYAKK